MKLVINKDRSVIPIGTWGTKNENDYEILEFEFPEELENYNKRIVYYLDDTKPWDAIVDNKAYITNAITSAESVKAYIWCTKENSERPADTDFRSQEFEMHFYKNENADGIVPTPVQVDGFNTMLTAMNAKIDEVDALEQTIETAEAERQEAEATRVSNETTRESNESTRQTNEQTRQTQEADRERRTDEAIGNIEDKTAEYNANAEAKTNAFNQNATQKTNDFNLNYTQKVNDFNTNATTQKTDFNTNASSKTSAFNSNAETKTNAFNTNATNKTNAFNSNATEKTTTFNNNATQKTTNFDNNASEKTDEFNTNAQNKIDEYDEHIVEYQAQIDELQEEVEELSENMPWNTTEQATEISVDDAAKYSKNKLELFGNTEQKFLLPVGYTAVEYIRGNGNQWIDTEYKPNNNTKIEVLGQNFKLGTDSNWYTKSFDIAGSPFSFGNTGGNITLTGNKELITMENGKIKSSTDQRTFNPQNFQCEYNLVLFAINRNGNIIEKSYYCKIYSCKLWENNTLVRDFIPCKNPDNEIGLYDMVSQTFFANQGEGNFVAGEEITKSIHVVTGENTIGVQGKNFLKINTNFPDAIKRGITNIYDSTTGKNNFSGTATGDYPWISSAGINTILQGTTLTFSISKTLTYKVYARLYYDETNYEAMTIDVGTTNVSKTMQHDITRVVILIQVLTGKTINDEIYLQLEQGSTATDYVPYVEPQDYPINLGSIELCKIGDYQDEFFKNEPNNPHYDSSLVENGWYKNEIIKKFLFKNAPNESWSVWRVDLHEYQIRTDIQDSRPNGTWISALCDKFKNVSVPGTQMKDNEFSAFSSRLSGDINYIYFRFKKDPIDNLNDFKTFVENNNLLIYAVLDKPVPTQITDTTLISQLDAIYEHLKLVKGTNNITVTAEDLKPLMKLSYMQDLPSKLDNLDSRLALLE